MKMLKTSNCCKRFASKSLNKNIVVQDPVFDNPKANVKPQQRPKQSFIVVQEGQISASQDKPVFVPAPEHLVPRLKHGLDRVLFSPGVHYLKDVRSGVYNFDRHVQNITQPEDFNFESLPPFRKPSEDQTLHQLARQSKSKFVGSTSSVSSALSQIYFALSKFKDVSLRNLDSGGFEGANSQYTSLTRLATSVIVKPSDSIPSVYTIDYCKNGVEDKETIMMHQGKILENMFTMEPELFKKLLINNKAKHVPTSEVHEAYAYCQYKNLLLRSQIDCMHPYLPRKTFDIKTRASVAIRLNSENHQEFVNYRIKKNFGRYNSYAKEYYDMMRSAFLKYCFQVRIGDMDGLFVSYHNTREIFGFQYVSREELDEAIFGSTPLADSMFTLSLGIFDNVLSQVRALYSADAALRVTFDAGAFGLKVYAQEFGPGDDPVHNLNPIVNKLLVQLDPMINDDIAGNFDGATDGDVLSVNYRTRRYSSVNGFLDEYKQLNARIIKRFNKEKDEFYVDRLRREFAPYMSEAELEDPDTFRSLSDQV